MICRIGKRGARSALPVSHLAVEVLSVLETVFGLDGIALQPGFARAPQISGNSFARSPRSDRGQPCRAALTPAH
jgi:hypothetical protein